MKILITGGAGFIGRWLVKALIGKANEIVVLDNLTNGALENINEFMSDETFKFVEGDILDKEILNQIFMEKFDVCYHLAASINVQESIDCPQKVFENDVIGTFNVLEHCKRDNVKVVFMSTCMVYSAASSDKGIDESHCVLPASPYSGFKIAGENLALSYYYTYKLPVVIVRPFNTYGPFQKSSHEGGVVPIFIDAVLNGKTIKIYGSGTQTRDLLYVEDCAEFLVACGMSSEVDGMIINAGLGEDTSINDLAHLVANGATDIEHVEHIHEQSEIMKLLCDNSKANDILNWKPKHSLKSGIEKTKSWIIESRGE